MGAARRSGVFAVTCALWMLGCGGDDAAPGGSGGDAGTSGEGGSGGAAGTGGAAGSSGSGGVGGTAGMGGSAGDHLGPDGGVRETCSGSVDCDDGLYCNGRERCLDGLCAAGESVGCDDDIACTSDTCVEDTQRCDHDVADTDGDGHGDVTCVDGDGEALGDDCADDDANRYPSNIEVCDTEGHDEDCDSTTRGDRDRDGDGFVDNACCNRDGSDLSCGNDCDDLRPSVNVAADENCNGRDDDCDANVDEDALLVLFLDHDHDLHGAPGATQLACPDTPGFSAVDDDCLDSNPAIHGAQPEICDGLDNDCDNVTDENPGVATWYRDLDGDGFGDGESGTVVSCQPVAGHVLLGNDCDDRLSGVNPAADEQCNGRDDDCNGSADFRIGAGDLEDDDEDGFPDATCTRGNDCDDRSPAANPAAIELCDGLDNDCDGISDNMSQDAAWYPDDDGDGFGDSTRPAVRACVPPRFYAIRGGDCDDSNARISPSEPDLCNDRDDDCDNAIDEDATTRAYYNDVDGDGFGAAPPTFACARPLSTIETGGDCNDTNPQAGPGLDELCNGEDDDCDGLSDEDFAVRTCGFGLCQRIVAECGDSGEVQSCIPGQPAEPDIDRCDQLDNDCDGTIDESASIYCSNAGTLGTCNTGVCEILACNAGYDDCNQFDPDGCEANLNTNAVHCGDCVNACAFGDTCLGGKCQNAPLSIAAGDGHTCITTGKGDVYCWGLNSDGQSGNPVSSGVLFSAAKVANLGPALHVSSSTLHTCALLADRTAACWGNGGYLQLGRGTVGNSDTPVAVSGVSSALEIAAGHVYTCWRDASQTVRCFGARCHNRLGHSNTSTDCAYHYGAPGAVPTALPSASQLTLGHAHGMIRISSGNTELRAWGYNGGGQLAVGNTSAAGAAPDRMGLTDGAPVVDAIDTAAGRNFSCAVLRDGTVMCAGIDAWGEVGNDSALALSNRFVSVAGIDDAVRIWAGHDHACVKHATGGLSCWGRNDAGQLLVDTQSSSQPTPIAITGLPGEVVEMAMGEQHTCAIFDNKRVACWGDNSQGQLGDNTGLPRSGVVLVSGLP